MEKFDVLIAGGGPAGLSTALILARSRRKVLLCDTGEPRNAAARALHGFLSRDGVSPLELRRKGREEICRYGAEIRDIEVVDVRSEGRGFTAELGNGECVEARKVVLATGMADNMPEIEGLAPLYGKGVYHCPFCDGWEVRDQPIAACARGQSAFRFALLLTRWSADLVLCTHAPSGLSDEEKATLARHRVPVREEPIVRLEGGEGALERIIFAEGEPIRRRALFVKWGERQQATLAAKLGCRFTEEGTVETGKYGWTGIEGLYVVGDASPAPQLVVVAAAEGAGAAIDIHTRLAWEDLGLT